MAEEAEGTGQSEPAPAAAPGSSLCRACKRPIAAGAAKCAECGADQEPQPWYVTYWKSVTGAAVVILTILIGFLTLYDRLFPGPPAPANLEAVLTCNQNLIDVKVTNSGGIAGTIDRPSFRLHVDGQWALLPIRQFVPVDPVEDSDLIVEPNEPSILTYRSRPGFDYFRQDETGRDGSGRPRCKIGVTVAGLTRPGERECECVYRAN